MGPPALAEGCLASSWALYSLGAGWGGDHSRGWRGTELLQPRGLCLCFLSVYPIGVLQMGALGHDNKQHHQPPHRLLPGLTPACSSTTLPSPLHTLTSCSTACMSF